MIVNLTKHVIRVFRGGVVEEIPSSGFAGLSSTDEVVGSFEGVPLVRTAYGAIFGLPAPSPGVLYVVSGLVSSEAKRPDVVSPDTGPSALRKDGQVWAVVNFRVGGAA
jgi:hypothetical protein